MQNSKTIVDSSIEAEFMRAAEAAVTEVLVLDGLTEHNDHDMVGIRHSVCSRPSNLGTSPDGSTTLEAVMEKRARPRGMQKLVYRRFIGYPWASRRIVLNPSSKILKYYDPAGALKGTVEVLGTTCQSLSPTEADGRENAFVLRDAEDEEVLLLAATSPHQREHWVRILGMLGSVPEGLTCKAI
jgi:hypothetical protein